MAGWAAGSAERVVALFEALAPGDARPREAIDAALAFAAGERRTRALFRIALAAHRAGREVGNPIGLAAARSASLAAACANIHAETTVGTLGHILGPAAYASLARELAAGNQGAAAEEELRWAREHATPAIRELLGRVPPAEPGRRRLDALQRQLDTALRRA